MVKEGIVLGYKISKKKIKVDTTKIEVIEKVHPLILRRVFVVLRECMILSRIHQRLL